MTHHSGWQGNFYEDFVVGDVYQHTLGRTVTTTDNSWFTLLTQNSARLHFDHEYAANTAFKKPLVNSCFTLALITGQSVWDISFNVKANLGWDAVKMPHPVFEGDTLNSKSKVTGLRDSKSHPDSGLVTVETYGYNQHGDVVISFERTLLVYRRGEGPKLDQPWLTTD